MGLKLTQYLGNIEDGDGGCESERGRVAHIDRRMNPWKGFLLSEAPQQRLRGASVYQYLEVRYAAGDESYLAFSGEIECPEAHEVIFADSAGKAHARRWTNRQSGWSAIRVETRTVLIVAEAMHESAPSDVQTLIAALAEAIKTGWPASLSTAVLDRFSPRFQF